MLANGVDILTVSRAQYSLPCSNLLILSSSLLKSIATKWLMRFVCSPYTMSCSNSWSVSWCGGKRERGENTLQSKSWRRCNIPECETAAPWKNPPPSSIYRERVSHLVRWACDVWSYHSGWSIALYDIWKNERHCDRSLCNYISEVYHRYRTHPQHPTQTQNHTLNSKHHGC